MTIEWNHDVRTAGATVDALIHREVVIRSIGPVGRTLIRSSIVDIAINEDGEIAVEVEAVTGHSFPLSTVTLIDDDDDDDDDDEATEVL